MRLLNWCARVVAVCCSGVVLCWCRVTCVALGEVVVAPSPLVIFAHERTGSNAFCDALNRQRGIIMNKEAFNPTESYLHGTMRRAIHPRVISNRNNQPRALVDAMVRVATRRRLRYVGFKIFPAHLSSGGIDAILRMQGARAVILYRKNVLAVYRSLRVAESTGHWTSTNTNRFKVRVDVGSFSHFKGQYAAWYTQAMQQVRAARVPVTIFEHSEFFANQRESLKRLQRFLELPEHYAVRASSSSSLRRQNTVPLRRSISNYASFSREVKSRYGSSVENFGSLNLAERPGRRGNY